MNKQVDQSMQDACATGTGIVRISVNGAHMSTRRIDPRDVYLKPSLTHLERLLVFLRELIYWPLAIVLMGLIGYGLWQFLTCGGCS